MQLTRSASAVCCVPTSWTQTGFTFDLAGQHASDDKQSSAFWPSGGSSTEMKTNS